MKLSLIGASTLALALALAGAPAASAEVPPEDTYLVTTVDGNELCLPAVTHGSMAYVIYFNGNLNLCSPITFTNEYIYNGNPWWNLQMSNGLCLNLLPDYAEEDPGSGSVYSDSCPADDYHELWYNDPPELINLEGNLQNGTDTYLQISGGSTFNGEYGYYLAASPGTVDSFFTGWSEVQASP
jgi:hypothetical protein